MRCPGKCPGRAELEEHVAGAGPIATRIGVERHLRACSACACLVERLERNRLFLLGLNDVLASPSEVPALPRRVGSYEIVRELGRGGVGVVYEAHAPDGTRVALKMLLQGPYAAPAQRRRFEREAELLATLHHPVIVPLLDRGRTPEGLSYAVFEFVDGQSLAERFRAPPHTADEALRRVRIHADLCAAVAYAHGHGVVHRDIKPSNVMLGDDGAPFVLDFGLAKRLELGPQALEATLTRTDDFLGTVIWAAPEQLQHELGPVGPRTDVYALGLLLHWALSGKLPFPTEGPLLRVVRQILERPPAPCRVGCLSDGDASQLGRILKRALAKDPGDRHASAAELEEECRRLLSHDVAGPRE